MDIVISGIGGGACAVSLVMFPVIFIIAKMAQQKQDNQASSAPLKLRHIIGMSIAGFVFTLASVAFAQRAAWNRGLSLGIEHIIVIAVIYLPIWGFAAYGTGTIDPARPEQEQLRERGLFMIGALVGHALATVLSAILFLD